MDSLFIAGNLEEAMTTFEALLSNTESIDVSDTSELWYYLGLCHQQLEQETKAITAFLKYVCY